MKVTVKLFAFLREGRFKIRDLEFPAETTVGEVLDHLSISRDYMKIGIIMINGKHGVFESVLQPGDTLAIFPPAAGG